MNQWIGPIVEREIYRSRPWQRFALSGPLSTMVVVAMLLGSTLLKPPRSPRTGYNAIEARLIELPAPKAAGLQGGPAAVPAKPAKRLHRKAAETHHPRIEAPPLISPSETSEVGTGPSASATSGPPSGKDAAVGVPGGTGLGNDASGARAIYAPTPAIPDDLRENVFQAVAVAHFKIAPDGTVEVTLTQPTPNPRLNQILLNTLRQWKFFPAMKDGVAINSEFDVRIPITVQ